MAEKSEKAERTEKRCFYELLGVAREAAPEEIRRAYKREALKHHPDRNPGNPEAERIFKQVNEAYQVLTDDQKRQIYDRFGHAGLDGNAGGGFQDMGDVFSHMQDFFTEMFSGGARRGGGDLRVQERLTLREAAFGCKREVTIDAPAPCDECHGTGALAGTRPEACAQCRGSGQVASARGFVMFTAPCPRCRGRGQTIKAPCKPCKGEGIVAKKRTVTVAFPAGIDAGQQLRVQGQGMAARGGPPGDLYVQIDVEEDARFERDGVDLVTRTNVSFVDATLGAELKVPALEATDERTEHQVKIAPGTQPGTVLTIKGAGVPRLDGRGRGSLVVVVQVEVPSAVSERAKALLLELDGELRASEGASRDARKSRSASAK